MTPSDGIGKRRGETADKVRVGTNPEIVTIPLVRQFFQFWRSRSREGRLPTKADMDPTEMRAFLRNIVLSQVHYDPLEFEYRIIGDELIARFGRNLMRHRVRQAASNKFTKSIYERYCAVVESRQPQFLEGEGLSAVREDRPILMSRVHCPLASDERIDYIISCVAFLEKW
jgi:hypothetical protein